jgi:TRAP-type C4-dicarboxylate transport system substrate-binding protein
VSRAINKLAPEYLADEFKDIHLMAILVTPPLYVHQRDQVNGLAGLSGKRIRSTGAGANAFLEMLGAIPVQMPAPAVYENLQTGVIDGALSESLALQSFRIGEVAQHHLLVNTTAALLFLGMNKAKLESLPTETQDLIKTKFSGPEIGAKASACWKKLGGTVVEELKAGGQDFVELSDADQCNGEGDRHEDHGRVHRLARSQWQARPRLL